MRLLDKETSRRTFLKSSTLAGGALVVGFFVPAATRRAFAQEGVAPTPATAPALPPVNAFLRIGDDESVTVILSHCEMGQGIWTTLPMLVNEELDADWGRIKVEHALAAPVYRSTAFPIQMTGGSTTTWSELDRYRQVGALGRTLLVTAAAAQWGVAPGDCRAEKGFVLHGDRRSSYGWPSPGAARGAPKTRFPPCRTPPWSRSPARAAARPAAPRCGPGRSSRPSIRRGWPRSSA